MTNDELNLYIKHYIEKDKTGRAIMLTGSWGIGKSYYIKNVLVPFLEDPKNGLAHCIVISLYGLSDVSEISKAIFLEAIIGDLSKQSKSIEKLRRKTKASTNSTALLIGKTIVKGITSHYGIDLSTNPKDIQKLYASINMRGKLIILEDVERSDIEISQLLGYVNSLVEQDGAKVLLVTNEEEILQYKPVEQTEPMEKDIADLLERISDKSTKEYTVETLQYLKTKEKAIGDTIRFEGDLKKAVQEIIQSFDNPLFHQFATDQCSQDVVDIMFLVRSVNLRSLIFACQKASDIFEHIGENSEYTDDFIKTIFYGLLFFSFRLHDGARIKWTGEDNYSCELGNNQFPLFRFCYDYITDQVIHESALPVAADALSRFRLYDQNKSSSDPDLNVLDSFTIYPEHEVINAADRVMKRLSDPADLSFHDYGRIAVALVQLKYLLGIDIDQAKEHLISNLKGRSESIDVDRVFWYSIWAKHPTEAEGEFNELKQSMINSLKEKDCIIPNYTYLPEQAEMFHEYIRKNTGFIYDEHRFTKSLDITRFVEMLASCSAAQLNEYKHAFRYLYKIGNIKGFLSEDLSSVEDLIECLKTNRDGFRFDRIQKYQIDRFIEILLDIQEKLS